MTPDQPPSPTLPNKRALPLVWKIWLSIAILLAGFSLVMLQGAWVGRAIQARNHLVTEHFLPAALLAQEVSAAYKAQLDDLHKAALTNDPETAATAAGHSQDILAALTRISTLGELPDDMTTLARENLDHYRLFAAQAFSGAESRQAMELRHLSDRLATSLARLADALGTMVSDELQSISTLTKQQSTTSLLIFLATTLSTALLVGRILSHSIIRPLKKTVALAHRMAAGDLSQTLDIRQDDEIGALARAMNALATKLKAHCRELEETVHEKTVTLQKANSRLVLEIGQRKDTQHELLGALAEIEQAHRAKNAFLGMMSHELRTPMNGIIGMSSLALDTALDKTQHRYLTTIRNSAETLLAILTDILDYAKIEANNLELANVDFEPRKVIDDISEHLSQRAHDLGLDFFTLTDPAVPDWLQGDATRLRQVLMNLAGNAIKFTQSGEVAMRMEVINTTAHHVTIRFAISDTGIGIAPERCSQLFEPFTQADISTTRKFGGTGLGLAISNRLVELMGGTIMVESAEGEGSTFWFTATFTIAGHGRQPAPARQDRPLIYREASVAPQPPPFRAPGARILVADADNTSLVVAEAILASFACVVDLAHTGQEAMDRLQSADYDLIFMDIHLPLLDGLEATAAITNWRQSLEAGKQAKTRIPVIALTADLTEDTLFASQAMGVVDQVEKPLRPATLAACLRKWLPTGSGGNTPAAEALPFSRERLLHRLGGDPRRLNELTLATRLAIPRYLADLDTACATNNCQQAAATCQEIKKMCAALGVAALQHHALHLCLAMENNNIEQTREYYHQLRPLLSDLLHHLDD
jgi:signal transduction histidine kinase/CheY-like chemotaxis protein/HPt (histidine-containing phosphotransfer) domain-containing protein